MQQIINMLDFRKSPGEVINEVFYNKKKFILERGKKRMAVIVPIDFYEKALSDEGIKVYTKERIREFKKEDKVTKNLSTKVKILSGGFKLGIKLTPKQLNKLYEKSYKKVLS